MKRTAKKLMATMLTLVLIFAIAVPAFAASASDEIVAKISVCSRDKEVPSLGHTWIYIQNVSKHTLKVGAYYLPAGEGVSIGTFANTRDDGKGVYYNIESHCINKFDDHDFYSITRNITAETLNKVSDKILTLNDWSFVKNCMHFTFTVWKTATGQAFVNFLFPTFGEMQLRLAGAKYKAVRMYYPTANRVYKLIGSGDSAYLTVVRSSSLETTVG